MESYDKEAIIPEIILQNVDACAGVLCGSIKGIVCRAVVSHRSPHSEIPPFRVSASTTKAEL